VKAVFVRGGKGVSVEDVRTPSVGEQDVLVRMRACGLCGSDLEKVYGNYGMHSSRLGHEPTGELIKVGKSVKGFDVGDKVFVHHHVSCYACHYCWHGDFTMCNMYQISNIEPCGLSEQFLVPAWNVGRGGLVKLPENITFDEACLIEPLSCCIRSLAKCKLQNGDDIAIVGAGATGLMHVILANLAGAKNTVVFDINQFRLDFAEKHFGVVGYNPNTDKNVTQKVQNITESRGVDNTIVATGSPRAFLQALTVTRKGGRIVLFGVPNEGTKVLCNLGEIYSRELSIIPSYAASELEINQAIRLISSRKIKINSLITHRFDITRTSDALRCAHDAKDAIKVIVTSK
jgi:L-iditol 2-dehydrogenase